MGAIGRSGLLRAAAGALLGTAVLSAAVATAPAAEQTRASYREAVEPICKADTEADERILAGVRQEVGDGRLKPAAARFAKAAGALKMAIAELKAVPVPAADAARLSKWLGKVSNEAGYFEAVAGKLRRGDKAGAQKLVAKLTTEADAANNVVLPLEFEYCRLEPSRFT